MTEKYFNLSKSFAMRGWRDLEYNLQHQPSGRVFYLPKSAADAVLLAFNGIPVNSPAMLPLHRQVLTSLVENGIGCWTTEFSHPEEFQRYRKAECNCTQSIHWSITGKCNMQCRHCYLDAPDALYGEMNLEQCITIMDQMVDANICCVSITGGEPLVRSDWEQFISALKERNLHIETIYTNGLLVTEKWIEKFQKSYPQKVLFSLSFDGIGCHDWLRGRDGMETRTIEAIKLLTKHGYSIEIETPIFKDNLNKLASTCELLANLEIRNWKLSPMIESKAWEKYSHEHSATTDEIITASVALLEKFEELNKPFSLQVAHYYVYEKVTNKAYALAFAGENSEKALKNPLCSCMRQHPYLLPDGTLMPCMPLANCGIDDKMPNLLKTPLIEVLQPGSKLYALSDMRLRDFLKNHAKECNDCQYKYTCKGGCRACAKQCGNLYGPDPQMCQYFKAGHYRYFEKFLQQK
jgi:radical SAM protein with 4Fe4S-binding SPASM domain